MTLVIVARLAILRASIVSVEAAATSDHQAVVSILQYLFCLAGTGRKHARVKYTVEDYGPEWFKAPWHLANRREGLGLMPC